MEIYDFCVYELQFKIFFMYLTYLKRIVQSVGNFLAIRMKRFYYVVAIVSLGSSSSSSTIDEIAGGTVRPATDLREGREQHSELL